MIKTFNTLKEQLDDLHNINYSDRPYLSINNQNHQIKTIGDCLPQNIKIYYSDSNHIALEEYLDLDKNYEHPEYHCIPKEAVYIDYLDIESNQIIKSEEIICKINQTPVYTIGLMSDVHYNDTDDTDQDPDTHEDDGAEYSEDLINAMDYFSKHKVDFVSCSGDISTDWSAHLKNYKLCCDKYAPEISIFTCSGNHDTKPKYKYHDLWNSVSAIDRKNEYDIVYFEDGEQYIYTNQETGEQDLYHVDKNNLGTSFYFKKYYNNTYDVFIYLNVEYGWNNPDNYNTHNCRLLNQDELLVHTEVDTYNDLHLYHPQTLQCLANILEENKDHRCFIFTHLMLPNKAGNYHNWDNLMSNNENYYEYANYSAHADILRGDQGEFIENLMNQYPNNYWFCGHSHYKWAWEKYDHNINVTKTNESYNIHLPSLSRPLPLEIYGYSNSPKSSEAALLEVYQDYVVLKGIVMKEENQQNINISEYPDELCELITSEMFSRNENNHNVSVEQLENGYIQINAKYYSSSNSDDNNIYVNPGNINGSNYFNYTPVLRFEDEENMQIWYDGIFDDMEDPNNEEEKLEKMNMFKYQVLFQDNNNIGFRDNTTNTNKWKYYLISNHIYTLYKEGLVFKISSQSQYTDLNLHIKFKAKLGFIHEGYINKYLPIAQFKL